MRAVEAPRLRPLGVGDIVDRVFSLYRARPAVYLVVAALPYVAFVLVTAAVTAGLALSFGGASVITDPAAFMRDPAALATLLTGALAFGLAIVAVALVILSAQSAALVAAFAARYLAREVTAGAALRQGLRAAPRVIGAGIVVFVVLFLLWVAVILVVALTQSVLVGVGLALAAVAASIYVLASTVVMPVVATLEGAGPIASLRRSWTLSEGNRWRIIGLQLLLLVLNVVLATLVSAVFLAVPTNDATSVIIQQVVSLVVNIAWTPVQWGTFTILYYDLRVRREAFDLQLAAEALPREP